ncbi:MAG: DUF2062 domain-containing protein [Rhodobacteraceae bacterium]|nr:DUF2062 domain-containing protein [Paracoccaceae bacterium]
MVFKRRDRLPFMRRVREFFLPRTGWRRAVRYLGHRIKRLPDTPHRIALGLAIGVFISFSPFFGLHILIGILIARVIGANVIAGLMGTFFGNPLTFPFIIGISYNLGRWMTGVSGRLHEAASIKHAFGNAFKGLWETAKSWFGQGQGEIQLLTEFWHEFFFPYLIGGLIPGGVAGAITYFVSRPLVQAYQHHRRAKLMAKLRKQAASERSEG